MALNFVERGLKQTQVGLCSANYVCACVKVDLPSYLILNTHGSEEGTYKDWQHYKRSVA